MIRFNTKRTSISAVLVIAFLMAVFIGCDDDDNGEPPPPPSPLGTYYGIGNFGAGEQSVRLVLQDTSSAASGGSSAPGVFETFSQALAGSISYGGETYSISSGASTDDSLTVVWTIPDGNCILEGAYDSEGITATTFCPSGIHEFVAYRQAADVNNITGVWYGQWRSLIWRCAGPMMGHFLHSSSDITGYLISDFIGISADTVASLEISVTDSSLVIAASDSTDTTQITMSFHGIFVNPDSAEGDYLFTTEDSDTVDHGVWNLARTLGE